MTDFSIPESSQADWEYEEAEEQEPVSSYNEPLPRSKWLFAPYLMPLGLCGFSYLAGGIPTATDTAFVCFVAISLVLLVMELRNFTRRFGMGLLIVVGGALIWYCHDYYSHWFGFDFGTSMDMPADIIAKNLFYTMMFVVCAVIGLGLPPSKRFLKICSKIPEPPTNKFFFLVILLTLFIGLIPFLFFSAYPILENIWRAMTAMRSGNGPGFTAGRSGNLNYNWGGYLGQVQQIGEFGGLVGAFYAILIPADPLTKIIGLLVWLFWCALGFGSGARGSMIYDAFPVVLLLYIRYNVKAAAVFKRFSLQAIIYSLIAALVIFLVVQVQGEFRGVGAAGVDFKDFQVLENQGNDMFSEGLVAYAYFPDLMPHPSVTFPGAAFVRPIPDTVWRWSYSWIPRALWHGKPGIGETNAWINSEISGGSAANEEGSTENAQGGTVAVSQSAAYYMYYGVPGIIEGGLLFGWLCKTVEVLLWRSVHRPLQLLFSLGCSAFLLRSFRDLTPHDFYPLAIGIIAVSLLIFTIRFFVGGGPADSQSMQVGGT
jgi:hypothetical protein